MTPRLRSMLLLIATLATSAAVTPAAAAPEPRGGRAFGMREPTATRTLANGLTVAVFQDDRQPLVQMQLLVPAGAIDEGPGESGLANLTFQMLGHGTASRNAQAFEEAVQALGGTVGGAVSREYATVNGTFLAADFENGLELLSDAVINPLFGEEVLPVVKSQAVSSLIGGRSIPATLADDHLWAAVFGTHPYGRPALGAPQVLSALEVAQVKMFHRQHYRPDRALLAIAGDVTPERAFKAAEDNFAAWGGRAKESPRDSLPPAPSALRVRIVDVPEAQRVELRLGGVGAARTDPDYEALTVAAELLSGGASRVRAGESGLHRGGLFALSWSAPVDSAGASLARVRAALARAVQEPPAAGDVAAAATRLAGAWALQFDTRGGLIAQWMLAALNPRPGAGDYAARVAAVTGPAVREALARHAPTVLVAVGPADRLRAQLQGLGEVEVVPADNATQVVETPSTARSAATPAQSVRGRALVNQALTAHGGLERLRGIKDSTIEGDIVMSPAASRELTGKIVQVRKDPERFRFETTFSVLKSLQVMNGAGGWSRAGDAPAPVEDLDSLSVAGLRSGFRSDIVHVLLTAADPATRVAWRGQERRDDHDVDVVELVPPDGDRRLLFLDVASHRLIATEQNDGGRSVRRIYRDLRDVGGVLWPYYEERYLDGQRAVTLTLAKVTVNSGVPDALFVKPGSQPAAPARSGPPRPR